MILAKDGFNIPANFNRDELAAKYDIQNLINLIEKSKRFLALKIVEIIGEDEPYELDPETIYLLQICLMKWI